MEKFGIKNDDGSTYTNNSMFDETFDIVKDALKDCQTPQDYEAAVDEMIKKLAINKIEYGKKCSEAVYTRLTIEYQDRPQDALEWHHQFTLKLNEKIEQVKNHK